VELAPRPVGLALDTLIVRWLVAVDAAQSAFRVAGSYLDEDELSAHTTRLGQERQAVARLLQGLAREQHAHSALLPWLDAPGITLSMLGLPKGVIACVFDLDGVLTTSATVHNAAWVETFDPFLLVRAERGHREYVPFDRHRDYQEYLAGRPRLAGTRAFLASRGINLPDGSPDDEPTAETVHGLANRKNLVLQDRLQREGVDAFAGSRSFLEAARMLGLRRAVISASANTQSMLARAGLAHLIDERIDAAAIETEQLRPRPAPDSLMAACRRLHVRPDQIAVFDTSPLGISAARAAGARLAIAVDRDGPSKALRDTDPDLVIGDLSELLSRASV